MLADVGAAMERESKFKVHGGLAHSIESFALTRELGSAQDTVVYGT